MKSLLRGTSVAFLVALVFLASDVTAANVNPGTVGSNQLANGALTADKVATVSNWIALTLTNPTPAIGEWFGYSVAAVGTNLVLIGVPSDYTGGTGTGGAAYLFSTDGALLTTFTNPTPANNDWFGNSVAGVGTDRVLIGAYRDDVSATDAGAAYLFSTNGALLTTFTKPTPARNGFGVVVAAVGTDAVLIGAYLFSTNGALVTTFTNPTPDLGDAFVAAVAGVGADRVLIGASSDDVSATEAGVAYLFSTNGALLTTFTNPTPAGYDYFGGAVAAVGTDRVLIGAYGDDARASNAGVAYLFSTNGALLTTFTNPTPALKHSFGLVVAAVGTDAVLIGAYAEVAYLFSTNGALLTTFTNPTPTGPDFFGLSVAGVGTDRVLIGAHEADAGAEDAGVAYLFVQNIGVTLLEPIWGFWFTYPITVSAWAYLPSGSITNIEFFVDGQKFGEDATPPFEAIWFDVVGGSHRLTAVGWSDTGARYNSQEGYIAVAHQIVPYERYGSTWMMGPTRGRTGSRPPSTTVIGPMARLSWAMGMAMKPPWCRITPPRAITRPTRMATSRPISGTASLSPTPPA